MGVMTSRPRTTVFVPIPDLPTTFRVGDQTHDADTHEGLHVALLTVDAHGWNSDAGRALTAALTHRCAGWAGNLVRRGRVRSADPGDVLSCAWVTLHRFAAATARADKGWVYLWTAVGNALAVDEAAASLLSERATRLPLDAWPVGIARAGLDPTVAGGRSAAQGGTLGLLAPPASDAIAELLAAGDAEEREFWSDAVDHAIDIMTEARHSYQETVLRRDTHLREVLGLTQAEVSALAALLIGPRRGDRAAQSLLLALHRDPTADPAGVVGAIERIRFLTSRSHAAEAAAASSNQAGVVAA